MHVERYHHSALNGDFFSFFRKEMSHSEGTMDFKKTKGAPLLQRLGSVPASEQYVVAEGKE